MHHSTSSGVMLSATGGAAGLYREEWEVDGVSEAVHECLEDNITIHSKNNPLNFSSCFANLNAPHRNLMPPAGESG